jgi:hypothetical protein
MESSPGFAGKNLWGKNLFPRRMRSEIMVNSVCMKTGSKSRETRLWIKAYPPFWGLRIHHPCGLGSNLITQVDGDDLWMLKVYP